MAKRTRFTIFDKMENDGVFDANPANAQSPNYVKVEYPKMLYHPQGEQETLRQGELVVTPFGPEKHGEQKGTKYRIVGNAAEEKHWVEQGWHLQCADAIAASGRERPATSNADQIESLQRRIAELEAMKVQAQEESDKTNASRPLARKAAAGGLP